MSFTPHKNVTEADFSVVDSLVINSADPNSMLYADSFQEVRSLTLGANQIIAGQLSGPPTAKLLQGTANQINTNDFKFSLPQDIDMKSTPSFSSVKLTDAPWFSLFYFDMDNKLQPVSLNYKQILTGNVAGPPLGRSLVGTPNQVNINDLTFSLPQDIDTKSTPTFKELTVTSDDALYRSGVGIRTTGRAEIFLNSAAVTNPTDLMFGFGERVDSQVKWSMGARGSGAEANMFRFYKAPYLSGSFDPFLEFLSTDVIRPGNDNKIDLGESKRRYKNLYLGGTITSGRVNGRDIIADGDTLDNLAAAGANYVTLDGVEMISGAKTFSAEDLTHEAKNPLFDIIGSEGSILRLRGSGANTGLRIQNTVDDETLFSTKTAFLFNGTGSTSASITLKGTSGNGLQIVNTPTNTNLISSTDYTFRNQTNPILTIKNNRSEILPGIASTTNLGSAALPFKHLYLGEGTGITRMGHSMREEGSGRAELHLHSNGDQPSDIMFGVNGRDNANVNWSMGARPGASSDFKFYRGGRNTGGAFSEFLSFAGAGNAIIPGTHVAIDIGEEKKRFKSIFSFSLTTWGIWFDPISTLNNTGLHGCAGDAILLNYNGTNGNSWWQGTNKQIPITVIYKRISNRVTITFDPISFGVAGGIIGSNWFDFTTALPKALWPFSEQHKVIAIEGNGNWSAGNIRISTTGKVDIFNGSANGGWTPGYSAGYRGFTITYLCTTYYDYG